MEAKQPPLIESTKTHWETVYTSKDSTQVSWFKEHLNLSLSFIQSTGVDRSGQIIDVGGGASTLVDDLLDRGFEHITLLDVSQKAISLAKKRLGSHAHSITWLDSDIRKVKLPHHFYEVWHDRAVFHFLTSPEDRKAYLDTVKDTLKPGGHLIIATFAIDGPQRCSGLEVVRYNSNTLQAEFGDGFELIDTIDELHKTPFETEQKFTYCYFRKRIELN